MGQDKLGSKPGFALLLDQLRQVNICTCKMMSMFPLALISSEPGFSGHCFILNNGCHHFWFSGAVYCQEL